MMIISDTTIINIITVVIDDFINIVQLSWQS